MMTNIQSKDHWEHVSMDAGVRWKCRHCSKILKTRSLFHLMSSACSYNVQKIESQKQPPVTEQPHLYIKSIYYVSGNHRDQVQHQQIILRGHVERI